MFSACISGLSLGVSIVFGILGVFSQSQNQTHYAEIYFALTLAFCLFGLLSVSFEKIARKIERRNGCGTTQENTPRRA